MDQNEGQQENQAQPSLEQPKQGLNKTYVILFVFIVGVGIALGVAISRKNTSIPTLNTQQTNTYFLTPTIRPTRRPEPTPTIRPTDPVVNAKKQYHGQNSGVTFRYPVDLEVLDEYIGPADDHSKYEIDVWIGKPENKEKNLYDFHVHKNRFDGAGSNAKELYKEAIMVDDIQTELTLYNECNWEETCKKTDPAYAAISFNRKGDFYEFGSNNIQTKDVQTDKDAQNILILFKEIISTVKFTN